MFSFLVNQLRGSDPEREITEGQVLPFAYCSHEGKRQDLNPLSVPRVLRRTIYSGFSMSDKDLVACFS
jgi:hypothetical protein